MPSSYWKSLKVSLTFRKHEILILRYHGPSVMGVNMKENRE